MFHRPIFLQSLKQGKKILESVNLHCGNFPSLGEITSSISAELKELIWKSMKMALGEYCHYLEMLTCRLVCMRVDTRLCGNGHCQIAKSQKTGTTLTSYFAAPHDSECSFDRDEHLVSYLMVGKKSGWVRMASNLISGIDSGAPFAELHSGGYYYSKTGFLFLLTVYFFLNLDFVISETRNSVGTFWLSFVDAKSTL